MSTTARQNMPSDNATPNPLEALSHILDAEMKAVNTTIVQHMESEVPLIPQLAGHLIAAGGKRIRPLLTLAAARLFDADMTRAQALAACVEFIHTATLLHDDVVDESSRRRGQEAANILFGNKASVLVGDFLFSRSFQLMTADGSLDVLRLLSNASAIIAQGEVLQLTTTGNLQTDRDQYIRVIEAKTAALFAAACEIGPLLAGATPEVTRSLGEYGLNLGIAFQIADDALDYDANLALRGKAIGDDFREGKMTAPVILALEKADATELSFWQRSLGDLDQREADLATAQKILEKHNAIEESLDIAASYGEKARLALAEAPDHTLRALLDDLVDYSIRRKN